MGKGEVVAAADQGGVAVAVGIVARVATGLVVREEARIEATSGEGMGAMFGSVFKMKMTPRR